MKTKKKGTSTRSYKKRYVLPTAKKTLDAVGDKGKDETKGETVQSETSKSISIEEYERQKQEILRLRKLTQTMQSQTNKVINLAREGKMDAFDDSFRTTVIAVTKRVIYPVCQYVSNSDQLNKCMEILANEMQLTDSKKAVFHYGYKHTVNSAIASRRNADVQSVRKELKGTLQ